VPVEVEGVLDCLSGIAVSKVFDGDGGFGDGVLGSEESTELCEEELGVVEPGSGAVDKVRLEPVEGGSFEVREDERHLRRFLREVGGAECNVKGTLQDEGVELRWVSAVEGIGGTRLGAGDRLCRSWGKVRPAETGGYFIEEVDESGLGRDVGGEVFVGLFDGGEWNLVNGSRFFWKTGGRIVRVIRSDERIMFSVGGVGSFNGNGGERRLLFFEERQRMEGCTGVPVEGSLKDRRGSWVAKVGRAGSLSGQGEDCVDKTSPSGGFGCSWGEVEIRHLMFRLASL
jgi:hypothetical protein